VVFVAIEEINVVIELLDGTKYDDAEVGVEVIKIDLEVIDGKVEASVVELIDNEPEFIDDKGMEDEVEVVIVGIDKEINVFELEELIDDEAEVVFVAIAEEILLAVELFDGKFDVVIVVA